MNSLVKKIVLAGLVVGLIAGGIGFYLFNDKVDSTKVMKADFSLKMEDLYGDFNKDEKAASAKYLGKVIEITGVVKSKGGADEQHVDVTLGNEAMGEGTVSISLETDQVEKAKGVKEGANVTIKGVCTGIQSSGGEGGGLLDDLGKEVQLKRGIIVSEQ
jgi:hypothetical protein